MERTGRIRIRTREGQCAACEQPHALDIVYRCVGCDDEVCALCVVSIRETGGTWCPACAPEDGPRPGGRPDGRPGGRPGREEG